MGSNFYSGVKTSFKFSVLLALVSITAFASGQNAASFKPAHMVYHAQPGNYTFHSAHQSEAPSTTCQTTDLALDYSTYNEIQAGQLGIAYDGSWNNINNIYAQQLSSLVNRAESDSFSSFTYAGVIFDTLGFGNYSTSTNTSIAYANTTVYLDSLKFFGGLSGDSTRMTNDSLVFTIYSITGNTVAVVKTIVYKGKAQLDKFFLPSGYLAAYTIPVHYQFTQGQSFAVRLSFQQQDTSGHFLLSYSYPDSCGSIVLGGNTYASPAHVSSFPGTSYGGAQVDTLTNSVVVDYQNSAYAYNISGIPLNCSYVYQQNWEIIPLVTYCVASTQTAPTVVTTAATSVTQTTASLNGTVNANGASSTTGFQWGLTTSYTGGTVVGVPSPVTGSTTTPITYALSGLTANTTYHFRALGTNTGGTTYGSDLTFTTLAASNSGSCDTLFNLTGGNDVPYIVTVGVTNDSGWFAGNNMYGLLGAAEGFAVTIGDHMSSAQIGFAYSSHIPADANKTVKIKVYDNTGTSYNGNAGAPGNAIDSGTVTLSQISTDINNAAYTSVSFTNNAVFTTDTVYIGVIFPTTTGDTVVLLNNFEGGDGDGWDLVPFSSPPTWESYTNDWGIPNTGNYIKGIMCSPSSSTAQCTPAPGSPAGVSPTASSVPCVTQGTPYTETYTLVVPSTVVVGGQTLTVTSVTIDSIGNLPSGLSWMANANPATYNAGASGCYIISGTSNAACGEYLTPIYITAVTNLGTFHTTLNAAGYPNQYLQVIASPHTCPTLNTSQTAAFVADANCGVSASTGVTTTTTAVLCFGGATGSATAHATGGTGTYTYAWSTGATTATISNVVAGTYTVTVTSGGVSATASAAVTQPTAALSVTASATRTSCSSNTGTTTSNVSGGTGSYTYHWSNGGNTSGLSGLAANTYTLTVTDANGCSATASATVSLPTPFTVTVTPTAVACFGQSTGSASASATGSTGNLTYVWSNNATSQTISNLTAASYSVVITDANGCSASASATVGQPATAVSASATATTTSCGSNTGTATVTATGGTAGYTYLWSNTASTSTISSLGVNTYVVTVTDAHSCTATASASVNTTATYTVNVTPTNVNCFGLSTGSASVSVTGSTGNVTYVWSNGNTTSSISSLPAGNYSVVVTDGSGCSKTGSATITQPSSALSVSLTTTATGCASNTGTATAVATGGTPTYTYVWSNTATTNPVSNLPAGAVNVIATDSKGCTASNSSTIGTSTPPQVTASATSVSCFGQSTGSVTTTVTPSSNDQYLWSNGATTASLSNVAATQYIVTVTDGFGCSASASATVAQPASALSVTPTTVNESCNGDQTGSISLAAAGGTSPYNYSWSNGNTTSSVSNLSAGSLSVTVTDGNSCSVTSSLSVTEPTALQVSISTTGTTNNGSNGTATATVTGGTTAYQYNWTGGQTTATATGLAVGIYHVTITDANNCTVTATATVTPAVGIDNVAGNITSISLIPNPANDQVKVVVSLASAQSVEFRLVDITGKYIYTSNESAVQGNVTHQINLSEYASGIYLVEITAGNEVIRKKLVITK